MKSFDISYFVSKSSLRTFKTGEEKIREAWESAGLVSGFVKRLRISRTLFIMAACLIISAFIGFNDYVNSFFHVVYFDGEKIGLVKDTDEVNHLMEDFIDRKEEEYDKEILTDCEITFTEAGYHFRGVCDIEAIRIAIENKTTYYSWAYMVYLDDEPFIYMESAEDLELLLESIKERYIPARRDVSLVSMDFAENITGERVKADPLEIKSLGEAFLVFNPEPSDDRIALVSRGSRDQNVNASSERESNVEGSSIVTVLTVEEQHEEEEIPFETKTVYNNEVESGTQNTLNEGLKGIKKITYHVSKVNGIEKDREKVETEIVKEPEDKIIEHGTKIEGGGTLLAGSGQFIWPVPSSYDGGGRIMRGFGGGHAGLDIYAGTLTSTPIVAADSGTVVLSGYNGGYGNTVVLNHGDYYTLYAHNSQNLVSVGESVEKGSIIAYMGNTGQTFGRTGIHLHFEIRAASGSCWQQSRALNPMNFF